MKTTTHTLFVFTFFTALLISCGKDGGSGGRTAAGVEALSEGSHYRVILKNLNGNVSGNNAIGTAVLKKNEEDFIVQINVHDAHAGVSHLQSITTGEECPTAEHDRNADGVIDAAEGESVYGTSALYLDGDLTTQELADAIFPSGSTYAYSQSIKLNLISVGLEGRTMVIHGVRRGSLPATALGVMGQSPEATVPIACGKIVRVDAEE